MNAALTETFTVQKWRIITFLSMTFLITFGPLAQLALLHSVHDAAAFIRELLSLPRALLSTLSDIMPTRTRASISHLLHRWPPLLCHSLSGMRAPYRFATPGLARRWVPRAVAHIHCPGNIVAPRRSPCFKGWCPGCHYRCLSPSHRLGPRFVPEVPLRVVFFLPLLGILLV